MRTSLKAPGRSLGPTSVRSHAPSSFRPATSILSAGLFCLGLTVLFAVPVRAAELSKDQQKCTQTTGKSFSRIDTSVGKQFAGCIKNNSKGKAFNTSNAAIDTMEECLTDDPKGKVGKDSNKAFSSFAKDCDSPGLEDPFPDYGAAVAPILSIAGKTRPNDFAHDIFGSPLDDSMDATSNSSSELR